MIASRALDLLPREALIALHALAAMRALELEISHGKTKTGTAGLVNSGVIRPSRPLLRERSALRLRPGALLLEKRPQQVAALGFAHAGGDLRTMVQRGKLQQIQGAACGP